MRSWSQVGGVAVVIGGLVAGWAAGSQGSLALSVIALVVVLAVPRTLLLAAAVLLGGAATAVPVAGPLLATDLLLIGWLARSLYGRPSESDNREFRAEWLLIAFVAWAAFATFVVSTNVAESLTPLLRIAVYAAVSVRLSRVGVHKPTLYSAVAAYALWNIGTGLAAGQTRLIGTLIGDPAQMGAVILAALIPIVTGDLRFPGRWVVAVVLTAGIWFTQTRSIWFATAAVSLVWVVSWRRSNRAKVVVALASAAAVGILAVDRVTQVLGLNNDSGEYRLRNSENGLRAGLESPLFGSGWASARVVDQLGIVRQNAEAVSPYNLFVNVFAAVGVIGLILLLLFLWALLGRLVGNRDASLMFVVAILAISVTEMTIYAGSLLTILFFVYAGVGLNTSRDRSGSDASDRVVGRGLPARARVDSPGGRIRRRTSGTATSR